jgi:hypothetical protein
MELDTYHQHAEHLLPATPPWHVERPGSPRGGARLFVAWVPKNQRHRLGMAKAMQHGLCPNPGRQNIDQNASKQASLQSRSLQLTTRFHAANLE